MPDPKDNAKLTGDTHLPDVESDLPAQGASAGRGQARSRAETGRFGRGVRKAGPAGDGGDNNLDTDDGDGDGGDGGGSGDGGGGGGDGGGGD
jgi:hypothetical protein